MDLAAHQWVVTLPAGQVSALGALRLWPGLELAQLGNTLWLRGGALTQELREALRKLPGGTGWRVQDRRLCRWDRTVPEAILPQLSWQPLSEALRVTLDSGAATGLPPERTPLQFMRSDQEKPARVLITSWEDWTQWAIAAPAVRLARLRFAIEAHGRAMIWGSPLPPLPGRLFTEENGVALPCGWNCDPPLPAPVLREWLGLAPDDLAMLEPDGAHRVLRADQIVPATRPNVRATASMT